jgi:hypothetical protein
MFLVILFSRLCLTILRLKSLSIFSHLLTQPEKLTRRVRNCNT